MVRACLQDPELSGVVHATSPNPVTNAELMAVLRRLLEAGFVFDHPDLEPALEHLLAHRRLLAAAT